MVCKYSCTDKYIVSDNAGFCGMYSILKQPNLMVLAVLEDKLVRQAGRFFYRPDREGWVEEISAACKGHDRLYNVRVFLGMVLRDIQTVFVLLSVSFCSAGRKTVPSI